MKILKHQIKALQVYRAIQQTKKEFLESLEKKGLFKELEKKYEDMLKKERVDYKTACILKRLIANPPNIVDPNGKTDSIIEKTLFKFMEKLGLFEKADKEKRETLILTSDGDLLLGPYCYPMRKEGQRLNIIRTLSKKFKKTKDICIETGIEKTETVRKYIGKINKKARFNLKLKKDKKIIESKHSSGYKISNIYKFIKK